MAHPNVTLDVESRRAREPEGLHVREHLSLEETALRPGTSESADQLVINRAPVLIYKLNPLAAAIVRVAVVHHDVKTVYEKKISS